MAQESNGDVDSAMAAFGASPMPYRNFTAGSAASADRAPLSNGPSATRSAMKPEQHAAFPLLLAVLPGIGQSAMPVPPVDSRAASEIPHLSAMEAKAKPMTWQATVPERPMPQAPEIISQSQQLRPIPHRGVTSALPTGHGPATAMPTRPVPIARPANPHTTPIAAMFHVLRAASPPQPEAAETRVGLQDIFSHL